MKTGYVRLGRSFQLDPTKFGEKGGDADAWRLAYRLGKLMPDDELRIIGRNTGEAPGDVFLPENVTNPWHTHSWRGAYKILGMKDQKQSIMQEELEKQVELMWPEWEDLDAIVMWMGQHGTSNWPIPVTGKKESKQNTREDMGLTKP